MDTMTPAAPRSEAVAETKTDSTIYINAQILAHLQGKEFTSWSSMPNIKGIIGARHALWQDGGDRPPLTTSFAVQHIKERGEITTFEHMKLHNIAERTARYDLTGLVEKKILTRTGDTNSSKFTLA